MCLILFAYQAHEHYKLIVAANRDEDYGRPAKSAHYWEDQPHILAGRDLSKLGTWLGVTTGGRFAALTNYRNPKERAVGKQSRGELVADFLKGDVRPDAYMREAAGKRADYPGYNLLAGDADELYYYSNVGNEIRRLEPGVYGVSNHLLDTPWPKVALGKKGLSEAIRAPREDLPDRLFALLQQSDVAPDEALPSTGVPLDLERRLSSIFIKSDGYGTRSSAVVLISEREITFLEQVYSPQGTARQRFNIALEMKP